ncbi:hypothetical protein M1437_02185 [Patescibacteria group bacterium]|nr:hypothetical protein [Patescibacteria group bacterium]
MNKEISYHKRLIFIILSTFFLFASFILFILFVFFSITFGHDFKEPKCFETIDNWYKTNHIKVNYEKRWQQHLECEKNMGFFLWGKEPRFSK